MKNLFEKYSCIPGEAGQVDVVKGLSIPQPTPGLTDMYAMLCACEHTWSEVRVEGKGILTSSGLRQP